MIALYENQPVSARVRLTDDDYLRTRYYLHPDGTADITVGRGRDWTVLACKECYGKAIKTVLDLEPDSCVFDLSPAARLGQPGLNAALEGILGGSHRKADCLTDVRCPALTCYVLRQRLHPAPAHRRLAAGGGHYGRPQLCKPPRQPADAEWILAARLTALAQGLPIETAVYDRQQLEDLGLRGLLTVGGSSGHPPALVVLRYTGAPEDSRRVGFVGKGVTVDSGGYCLKSASSMAGIKGDMAGGAAAAAALHALARHGVRVNVTAVIPTCENRISPTSMLPGDRITLFSGQTVEILNADAEGRLILADGLTWAIRREGCTHLVDIATLTGAVYAMLGYVTTGVMASDDEWYGCLTRAAGHSGERFWRMPDFPEYEDLIRSDYADVRNTSKDGCGAITAGLFLKHFTQGLPWLHLDIAGTADNNTGITWQHQTPGATGAAVSTLYYLARELENA